MLPQETTENIKWILEVLQYYASDAFGRVETVLVDKDYKEIKALSLMMPFSSPDARFSHVHLDLVGPLPLSNGQTFLLTCVDRFTRWAEAIPISYSKTETVVRAFLYH